MTKNTEHTFPAEGIRALRDVRLLPEEKRAVLVRLLQYIDEHPVTGFSLWRMRFLELLRLPAQPAYAFGGIVFLLLVTGGGATFAAEGALPGDLLYPVKIYVNESVQGVLKVGDARKAEWEAEKTVRRLEEAESLATEGRLSTTTIEAIKVHVEESVSEFHAIVKSSRERETSEEEKEEIENVHADFNAELDTHTQILSVMGESSLPDRDIEQKAEQDDEDDEDEEDSIREEARTSAVPTSPAPIRDRESGEEREGSDGDRDDGDDRDGENGGSDGDRDGEDSGGEDSEGDRDDDEEERDSDDEEDEEDD